MVSKIDARSVKLRHVYDERRKTLDDKFTQSSDILRNEIKNRSNIIDTKNQLLERTTFRGKAMEKLLNGLPEGRRKSNFPFWKKDSPGIPDTTPSRMSSIHALHIEKAPKIS